MPGRIAGISAHASPLAATAGVDACGENAYVAHAAKALAALGYQIDVFTRRDHPELPAVVQCACGVRMFHIEAEPPRFVRKEDLLPAMAAFAARVLDIEKRARDRGEGYELAHADFFLSGLVARRLRNELGTPYVVTFHALPRVRVLHHGRDDFPNERGLREQMVIDEAVAVIAQSPGDMADLKRHYDGDTDDPELTPEIGRLKQIAHDERIAEHVKFIARRALAAYRLFTWQGVARELDGLYGSARGHSAATKTPSFAAVRPMMNGRRGPARRLSTPRTERRAVRSRRRARSDPRFRRCADPGAASAPRMLPGLPGLPGSRRIRLRDPRRR